MKEETVSVDLDQEVADKVNKMTKKELAEQFVIATLEAHIAKKEAYELKIKLDKAKTSIEQSRVMIIAIIDRW